MKCIFDCLTVLYTFMQKSLRIAEISTKVVGGLLFYVHPVQLWERLWKRHFAMIIISSSLVLDERPPACMRSIIADNLHSSQKTRNVAIVMHCNLRLPDAMLVLIHFDFVTHSKSEVARPISCCLVAFLLLIRYVILWSWPLTLNICSITAVPCSNSVLNLSAIEQSKVGVIAIWMFDLMILNMYHMLSYTVG